MVFGGNEPRIYHKAASLDREVVISPTVFHAPHFDDAKAPPLGPVFDCELLQSDDPVCDTVKLKIVIVRREIIEQQHRAAAAREKIL